MEEPGGEPIRIDEATDNGEITIVEDDQSTKESTKNNKKDTEVSDSTVVDDKEKSEEKDPTDKAEAAEKKEKCKKSPAKLFALFICPFVAVTAIISAIIFNIISARLNAKVEIVSVSPDNISNDILANNSSFTVTTKNGSVDKVRNALYLEPSVDYTIEEISADEYKITPATRIADNTIVTISDVDAGIPRYKWAFQTKKDLSVSKIYPADGASYVAENSVIQFSFSYPNVEDVDKHFSITPEVSGSWTREQRTWTFHPDNGLQTNTNYTITISSGLEVDGQVMKKDFSSTFSTFSKEIEASDFKVDSINIGGINSFTTKEPPVVKLTDSKLVSEIKSIRVQKISDADSYIKYLKGESVEKTDLGNKTFTTGEKVLILAEPLPAGYYVFELKTADGGTMTTANVEVSDYAAYALQTEKDVLVWAAENGEIKQDINIRYRGKEAKTSSEGHLVFKNINDYSGEIDYLTVGDNNPLVVGLASFENKVYPKGYIYVDRPLYKPTDEIHIWGYVPLSFFADKPDTNEFYLSFGEEKWKANLNDDGTFESTFSLRNYKDTTDGIILTYNGATIATRSVTIENYMLQNYVYSISMEKNYVVAGANIDFDVEVTHVTGLSAVNKDIVVSYDNKDYYGTTNYDGKVHFSIPAGNDRSSEYSTWATGHISVQSGGVDYGKYTTDQTVYIIQTDAELMDLNENDTLSFEAYYVDTNKDISIEGSYYSAVMNTLRSENYNGNAEVTYYESENTRVKTGMKYNEYLKKDMPEYDYNNTERALRTETVKIENGKVTVKKNESDFKENTETKNYSYRIIICINDRHGRRICASKYYKWGSYAEENSSKTGYIWGGGYGIAVGAAASGVTSQTNILARGGVNSREYNYYERTLANNTKKYTFNIGDSIELVLNDANGPMSSSGRTMIVSYKENVNDVKLSNSNRYVIEFNKDMYAGSNITGAYFEDGRFYRMPSNYYDYDEKNSELSVEVKPENTDYKPGEEVKGKLYIKDKNGNPVNGKANISVVNEAVFNSEADNTDILRSVYSNKVFQNYSFSSYRNYEFGGEGGGLGAGAGAIRRNFGDTIFFGSKEVKNGEVDFSFKLNDSITAFRITAHAISNGDTVQAGAAYGKVNSTLPLSVTSVAPQKVKSTDDLVLNATAIKAAGEITYTFRIDEINKEIEVKGSVGHAVTANLGKLPVGKYTATIVSKDGVNEDKLSYPVEIVETAQEVSVKETVELKDNNKIKPSRSPIIVELYNRSMAKYLKYLDHMEQNFNARLDTQIAHYRAVELRNKFYGEDVAVSKPELKGYILSDGSVKALENAESDLVLTALANYYGNDYIELKAKNFDISLNDSQDKMIKNLLVLASFKEPVLLDLKKTQFKDLNAEQYLELGLAYAFLGDYKEARNQYNLAMEKQDEIVESVIDLKAILAAFIDKENVGTIIDQQLENKPASDYLNFAILAYFENYYETIDKVDEVVIKTSSNEETVKLNGLRVVKKAIYEDDLAELSFDTKGSDVIANYHYQGRVKDLGDFPENMNISLSGEPVVGQNVELKIDISNLPNRNGIINVALPAAFRLNKSDFSYVKGLSLMKNNNDYVTLALDENFEGNVVTVQLYTAQVGNYEFEPIVFSADGTYSLSNSVTFDAR